MINYVNINDLNTDGLEAFTKLNENELKHYFEPESEGIFIAETPMVVIRALESGYEPLSLFIEKKYISTSASGIIDRCNKISETTGRDIDVYTAPVNVMSKITGYNLTRGVLGAFRRKPLREASEIMRYSRRIAVLENVENPTNIGAIFRSAAALNADAIMLTPGCADPLQRRAIRAGVGTVFQIDWTCLPDIDYVAMLKNDGFITVGMALRSDTTDINDIRLKTAGKIAVFLGNEGNGLKNGTICACDHTVKIPMSHGVDSLNVAAASAIAFYELFN